MLPTSHSLAALEAAINYWRSRSPAQGEARILSAEVNALATPYAQLILDGRTAIDDAGLSAEARAALAAWRKATGGETAA